MKCPHCFTHNPDDDSFQPIEGGRGYALRCRCCHHVIDMRPRQDDDPPAAPDCLTPTEIARLRFVRWLLMTECRAQTDPARRPRLLSWRSHEV